ncbi:hypothetical protein [Paenibacillus silvisoli]|uniref:hypothetical protein n=1 Tax=Paenibacillus silvisoli TaxID=3110539 RepID=UPI0028049E32|nr:hypothetical protein [Paenibacillus silvisoli]
MRSNPIKEQMNEIPLPAELHERSVAGIRRAATASRSGGAFKRKAVAIAAALALFLLGAALVDHSKVWAAIQKALQFVPGIGIVKEGDISTERYVMKQPLTIQIGEGTVQLTGFMSDEEMTYITMAGEDVSRFKTITLVNELGDRYTLNSSSASWGGRQWTSGFWHKGKLDLSGAVKLVLPLNPPMEVPIQLTKAESYSDYAELGETVTASGVSITAITDRVGDKIRVSLVSRHPDDYRIDDYGIHGVYMHDEKLELRDEAGKLLTIEKIPAISSPANAFYFADSGKPGESRYTMTLPEISVTYNDETTIEVPVATNGRLNQPFELAGFPVTITKTELVGEQSLRLYLDMHYDEKAVTSLYDLTIGERSHMAKLDERTGAIQYLEFDIEPGSERIRLKLVSPGVIIRGPWQFQLQPS